MAFKDLREYIARLEEEGEIQRIEKEVDWNLEIGAIIRRALDLSAPAPFFQKIVGSPPGYRLLASPNGTGVTPGRPYARVAVALGLPPNMPSSEMIKSYHGVMEKDPIKPVMVSEGPCQEEVYTGDDIDLLKFPTPVFHEGDGGRYIGTWLTCISKDPETGKVNWGMYRVMIHDKKHLLIYWHTPQQHMYGHYLKYKAMRKPMPFALAIGTEPITPWFSGGRIPLGVEEPDVIGGVLGEPIELVKCKTVDLEVPATTEIVIEGEVSLDETAIEGPFAEVLGYISPASRGENLLSRVTAITHRHDPILICTNPGPPPSDSYTKTSIEVSANVLRYLKGQGLPVKMAYAPLETSIRMILVSSEVPFRNYAKHLAIILWGIWGGKDRAPYLAVYNEDIDVTNFGQAMWALTTRCNPAKDIHIIRDLPGMALYPFLSKEERQKQTGGACTLFDCTWPLDWPKENIPVMASFEGVYPKEIREMVLKNWSNYGFKA